MVKQDVLHNIGSSGATRATTSTNAGRVRANSGRFFPATSTQGRAILAGRRTRAAAAGR